ncbi:carbohydrate ABC transporter permease [Halomarina halobia]|uniref:Carbohydrate ABC transporter permease n=1 Tax=Halomarina halobia TaxID=3033386 RepID=A0ABD6AE81_9EURY|nr:carbohydrate ABC transporter permease [Halomarina sp. PSR21]
MATRTDTRLETVTDDPVAFVKLAVKYGFGVLVSLWMLFPIFWMVTTGLKEQSSIMNLPPDWLLFEVTFQHFTDLFTQLGFQRYLFNSFVVAGGSVAVSVIVGVPAAYALSRLNVPADDDISFYILSTRMVPPLAILVPLYIFYTSVGLTDSLLGLTITHLLITLPMVIWIVKGFIDELPSSLEESALVDGCNRVQAFREIVVPLVTPGIAAAAFIGFIFSWNNFMLALVLTSGGDKTAPLVIQSSMGYLSINWGMLGAAGTLTILPPIVLSLLIRDYLVEGMTMGAVKE